MGRSFDGGYAEYALLPEKIVFKIDEDVFDKLTLEEIIAIPETYFTAYGSLMSLNLVKDDTLLIRGATSALGLSAMQLANSMGCEIFATSRSEERFGKLKSNGADECFADDGCLAEKLNCDKVLELIGPKTLEDSMKCINSGGICCVTGVLGGIEYMDEFDPIKIIPNGRYLTSFFSNYPTQEIMDNIFDFIIKNNIKPEISRVFYNLEDIGKAHTLMESNMAQGKIIFKLE
nr:zinc-binding dehydrogenase [Methanobrevibacter gottschalkii]